ncbi:MAG: CRISPR-associated protein Cas4 [Nitrospirae bacterium]|nr:CRISPR-associated protein Cas4 [Nitrospirota bacterium]
MYTEETLLPISALQHIIFCERQCALIHIEGIWTENLFTAEGKILHERVDSGGAESRKNIKTAYSVALKSLSLGLTGKADVVEYHKNIGKWIPFPVEYKRGRSKIANCDRVQLCAQAMCLEEMTETVVSEGAIFYAKPRRREGIVFDESLRHETIETAKRLHDLINSGITPLPQYNRRCESCSLVEICMPKRISNRSSVKDYLEKAVNDIGHCAPNPARRYGD